MQRILCTSTKQEVVNVPGATRFKCPECGAQIVRSNQARLTAAKYHCSCGFEGPN